MSPEFLVTTLVVVATPGTGVLYTLAWERDGILYRIEGDITLARALEIATSMRETGTQP